MLSCARQKFRAFQFEKILNWANQSAARAVCQLGWLGWKAFDLHGAAFHYEKIRDDQLLRRARLPVEA